MAANITLLNTLSWAKFDGTAYSSWSAQTTNKLLVEGYWDIVSDQNPCLAPPTLAQLVAAAMAVAASVAAPAQQVFVDNIMLAIET
ncbi:hypothetical protein R1flu_004655 [Riccia fluitans]|uniref:Uncharacterized protein n=1 Tax=Riccia fluitans TaxID=41844 RepID=A0ABD1YQX2_9MARC